MQFNINLATKIYLDTTKLNLSIGILFALLLGCLSLQVSGIVTRTGEISRLSREIGATAVSTGKGGISAQEYERLLRRVRFANDVIARKTLNWQLLLDRIEGVVPDGIVLTAIIPNPNNGSLTINGAGKGFGNIRQLLENLEGSKLFSEVYLGSQKGSDIGDGRKGLAFTITCKAEMK